MAVAIETTGDIECLCTSNRVCVGGTAEIVFRTWDDVSPPFTIKISAPTKKVVYDRVLRDQLPTGRPQSNPPVRFTVADAGVYKLRVAELYGKAEGTAKITIS